ncbi:MAG: cellulase family glycosylhydrolase [Candidatus Marinimicrobia bacterium]|nr:cellulase family glycosylhydrolase [Candidatus Neomarinimicrobiota bacterium]
MFRDKKGNTLFLLGANYWPSSSALNMWTEWNPKEIQDDIKRMKDIGMNCCRPFLYMPAFMDSSERVNALMIERLHFFMNQCESWELYTFPTFIVGHMSGEDWDVRWGSGANFISDSNVIAITKKYIISVIKEIKSYSTVLGWLLSNELPNYVGNQAAADVEKWAKEIIQTIKDEDPDHPVSIGDGAWGPEITGEQSGFVLRKLNKYQDFVGLHYYPRGMNPWHHSFTTAFRTRLAREWNLPVIVEEFGTSTTLCSEKNQAAYYRNVFYSALINGAQGTLSWCLNDFDFENKRPYSHHTYEERFGIVKTDKTLKPAAEEFQKFKNIASELIQLVFQQIEQPAALFIPSNYYYEYPSQFQPAFKQWYDLYLETFSLMKRANLDVTMVFEPAQELENNGQFSHELQISPEKNPVLFIPRMKLMTKPMRIQIDEYIQNGGKVYFSFANDSWVLDWDKLAGVETDCKFGIPDFYNSNSLEIRVKENWGSFTCGEKLQIPLNNSDPEYSYCLIKKTSGNVIMEDSSGSPFLIERSVGKGTVYFCTFPIEMLALASHNEQWKNTLSRIYGAINQTVYRDPIFSVEGIGTEMGVWQNDNLYHLVIFNHNWIEQQVVLTSRFSNWTIEQSTVPYVRKDNNQVGFLINRKSVCHLTVTKH